MSPRHGPDRLALVEHQAGDTGFELVSELPARSALRCVGHRSGHRIPTGKMSTESDQANRAD
jgi:hypothetical protein